LVPKRRGETRGKIQKEEYLFFQGKILFQISMFFKKITTQKSTGKSEAQNFESLGGQVLIKCRASCSKKHGPVQISKKVVIIC
jgi:hypothetical protein